MWAQLITARLKPGKDEDLLAVMEQLRALEQPGSGLVRSTTMRDENDPSRAYMLVVFESEEKARAREKARETESDPGRREATQAVMAALAGLFDGAPEFTDLTVVEAMSP